MTEDGSAPPRRFVKHNWQAVADAARRTPWTWRRVAAGIPRSHAQQIKAGDYRAFRADPDDKDSGVPFMLATRDGKGSHADLWVMYTPDQKWVRNEHGRLQRTPETDAGGQEGEAPGEGDDAGLGGGPLP